MARNQPFDFSDDDDASLSSRSTEFDDAQFTDSGLASPYGMSTHSGDTGAHQTGAASQTAQGRATTTTPARESAESRENTTPMSKKRGNQPR